MCEEKGTRYLHAVLDNPPNSVSLLHLFSCCVTLPFMSGAGVIRWFYVLFPLPGFCAGLLWLVMQSVLMCRYLCALLTWSPLGKYIPGGGVTVMNGLVSCLETLHTDCPRPVTRLVVFLLAFVMCFVNDCSVSFYSFDFLGVRHPAPR